MQTLEFKTMKASHKLLDLGQSRWLFAREDYVEEAWRIVDPVLKAGTPVLEYEPKSWGPEEVNEKGLIFWAFN